MQAASTVYVGTHYEYTTALSLMRLGFSLLRTGAKNDAGIDLIGHWVLAPVSEPLPIIVQCKARKSSLGPLNVRELEGSFQGVPPDWKGKTVLGLLVTTLKATKGTLDCIAKSPWPMGFVMMSRHGLIQQFVWNRAASERGLQGVGATLRHTPRALLTPSELLAEAEGHTEEEPKRKKKAAAKFANTGTQKDIQLTWMGSPIFPDRNYLDQDTVRLIHQAEQVVELRPTAPLAHPRRGPGRPRKEIPSKELLAKGHRGPRPTMHLAPSPRGGQIAVPRKPVGRPKGSKNKVTETKAKKAG
ncbi:hypothetical protein G6514_002949 [Epicoccum nigrum]|nr:hypothetical protein G6514_002949 [Epicoccum nigrum]